MSELAAPGSVFVPCPFCASADIAPAPRYSFPVSTRCNDCGATGPQKLTGREADAAWALRAVSVPPNAKLFLSGTPAPDAEYDVICGDECVASASGPREDAWREAMHYAQQYKADGDVEIWEVTRRKVWHARALPQAGQMEASTEHDPFTREKHP